MLCGVACTFMQKDLLCTYLRCFYINFISIHVWSFTDWLQIAVVWISGSTSACWLADWGCGWIVSDAWHLCSRVGARQLSCNPGCAASHKQSALMLPPHLPSLLAPLQPSTFLGLSASLKQQPTGTRFSVHKALEHNCVQRIHKLRAQMGVKTCKPRAE